MKYPILIVVAAVSLLLSHTARAGEVRTWTDDTGEHKIDAAFVSLNDDVVTLHRPGSRRKIELPIARLSDEDREYVHGLVRSGRPDTNKEKTNVPSVVKRTQSPAGVATDDRRPPNNVANSVRGAVYRVETMSKMRQIAMGLVQYESLNGRFPAAAILMPDRKPGLSWRVAILPMLDMNALYRQFRRNEPWDSVHNRSLIARMPSIYQSPGSNLDNGLTNYLAVTAADTIISTGRQGARVQDVVDGLSSTVMIVEADDKFAAVWTQPVDYAWNNDRPSYGLGNIWPSSFFAAFGDGSVRRMEATSGADRLNSYFSRNGGEPTP